MEDSEVIKIAAFKLRDAANRLQTLAEEAHSKDLRERLCAISAQLIAEEERVFAAIRTAA